jgi:DNA-binding transcriptional ArsR family regulator
MADQKAPDYELAETLPVSESAQFRALFEDTRIRIVDLLLERAATISELAQTLEIPKGTIGHHVGVLEEAGLIRVVRTKKVRAIEAKYYGRTARTYLLGPAEKDVEISPDYFLASAAAEYGVAASSVADVEHASIMSTLRYARIPDARAEEWLFRLGELAQEFVSEKRGGKTTFALLMAFYPTDRPHLPDLEVAG